MRNRRQSGDWRRAEGFTIVELLVVIGLIMLLAGLLLPAGQAARESARRATCGANLRQLWLAIQAYEAAYNAFPPAACVGIVPFSGGRGMNHSPHSQMLPYLEQASLFAAMNFSVAASDILSVAAENETASRQVVATFLCPSDLGGRSSPTAGTNFRACVGSGSGMDGDDDGAFNFRGRGLLSGFGDGTSNTLAFSEKPISSGLGYESFVDWVEYEEQPSPRGPSAWLSACASLTKAGRSKHAAGSTWLVGGAIYTHFFTSAPPNSEIPDCGTTHFAGTGIFAARSRHPGAVNAAMADGSVRPFGSRTNLIVWRALGTRSGGEVNVETP